MRKLLFNLHLYLALVLGIFVVIIGVTGSLIAFEGEIDRATNSRLFHVEPQGQPLSPSLLLAAAKSAFPGKNIGLLRFPQNAEMAAVLSLPANRQVFLNPYTGLVIGSRSSLTWLSSVHQMHQNLWMGKMGANVVTFVTAILLFLVVSGVYLWWPLKRAKVKWGASARRVHFDLHNTAGIYSAAILFVLACTGITIHFDNTMEQWLHKRAGTSKIGKNTPSVTQAGATPVSADRAAESALSTIPNTKLLYLIAPANANASYMVALHHPEDLTPGGRSWVNIDQYSGKPLSFQDSRTVAWGTRTIVINRSIHTGDALGTFSKIVMSLTCLLLVSQAITGYYLWWKKLRTRQREKDAVAASAARCA